MIGLGIGIPLTRTTSGPTLGTTIATTHYNRVIADGGVLPAGISGLGSVLDSVISAYGVTDSADFNTKVPVFLDPQYTGYKLGAGAGTTAGQAARTVYAISSSADVTQTTAASQPLLLAWSGVNYWWGSGAAGNYCSSPITISSPYSNDFEIQVNVQNSDISGTYYYQTVFSVGENYSLGIVFANNNIGVLQNNNVTAQTTVGISSSIDGYYKVTKETLTYSFYSSNDAINWTLIERVNNANMSFVFTGSNMCVGSYANAGDTRANWRGKIRRIKLWIDGLSNTGTLSFDFNPMEYLPSSSQTNWNSSTGEVWSINTGTAAGGYKGQIVDRTYFQNDGIDDCLIAILSGSGIKTQYFTHKVLSALNGMPFGLYTGGAFAQAFYYPSTTSYGFYQSGPQDGPFGTNVSSVKKLRVSGAVGGTGTDWIPFQNGVDVSNGGFNVGSANSYTSIRISVRGNDTGYDNGIVGNYIVTNQADTSLQRTTIQNLLKTMSNL